jgi:NAD+ synthase
MRRITRVDADVITGFIAAAVRSAGCKGAVVGLSGGIDSATVTKLCADALGSKNVLNIFMPASPTPLEDRRLTEDLSRTWGTEYRVADIGPAADAFTSMLSVEPESRLERGNIYARCRMIVLYDAAKRTNRMVVGTSNKSELMMGYFTKFGDGASDLTPIAGLYKTQVRQLAEVVGVPKEIIERAPSAGLWEGQTDEGEMGITYRDLDRILCGIENGLKDGKISECASVPASKVSEVRARMAATEHKRASAKSLSISTAGIGKGRA